METERKAELKRQEQERQGIEEEKQLFINNYKEISNSKIIQKALNDKVRNALDDGKGVEKVIHGIKFLEFDNVLYFAKGIITAYKIEAKIVKKLFGTKTMQEKIPYEVNA